MQDIAELRVGCSLQAVKSSFLVQCHHDGSLSHSVLSQCIHAVAALLYPFTWAHTYIPVVPECLLDTVCCPTPFMVGIQMRHLERVLDQPMEEVFHPGGGKHLDGTIS